MKTVINSVLAAFFLFLSASLFAQAGTVQVKSAVWGLADQTADVTNKVQSFADSKAKFRAHIVDLESNPTNRKPKILTIVYVKGGQEKTVKLQEGKYFTFFDPADVIQIKSATWAVGAKSADVTKKVQEIADSNAEKFEARNHILGADPAAGQQKTLTVVYIKGGKEITKSCLERQFFTF